MLTIIPSMGKKLSYVMLSNAANSAMFYKNYSTN
jgi:hypothetical protein